MARSTIYREPLTPAQLNALAAFQTVHGRNWKRALKAEWLRPGVANPDPEPQRDARRGLARQLQGRPMKRAYQISNSVGTVAGVFEGNGPADALATMHRRAGYDARAWLGEVIFGSQEHADLCGGVAEWKITPVNKKVRR